MTVTGEKDPAGAAGATAFNIDAFNSVSGSADGSYLINDGDEDVITYTPQPVKQSDGSGSNGANWTHAMNMGWTAGDYQKDETFSSTAGDEYSFEWYRTKVDLNVPEGQDVAWRLNVESEKFGDTRDNRTDGSQVMLYVNGWHTGICIGDIGPQQSFTVPAGFLNPRGSNDIAVVVAAKAAGMGPQNIRLVPQHNTTGATGDMEANEAPAYPEQPKPTTSVDATTVTASGTVGDLPLLGDGAITAQHYEWKAPGETEGTVGEAAKVLNGGGVHQVRTLLVDAVSGQVLSSSDWVDVMVDGEPTPTVTMTPTVTVDPTVTATPTVTVTPTTTVTTTTTVTPTVDPTVTVTPTATTSPSWTRPTTPPSRGDVYTTPGYHDVNGRRWFTTCEPYSQTWRCSTDIWATQVTVQGGKFVKKTGWFFNNLTYLPSPRAHWSSNPLGFTGAWTSLEGRKWMTECDTPATGRNGCRSYIWSFVVESTKQANGSYTYAVVKKWTFNNIVLFS